MSDPHTFLHLQKGFAMQERTRLLASASLEEVGPELCNSWEWMVDVVMHNIVCRLDANAVKIMRFVCKRWRHVVDRNLESLRPSKAKIHTVVVQFPNLRTVDLSGVLASLPALFLLVGSALKRLEVTCRLFDKMGILKQIPMLHLRSSVSRAAFHEELLAESVHDRMGSCVCCRLLRSCLVPCC
jgi:hypothetical protein